MPFSPSQFSKHQPKRGKSILGSFVSSSNGYLLLGSLRIDDFRMTMPLDCVTGLLRMLIWALAGVAPKSTPLLTAIRRRPRKAGRETNFRSFPYIFQRIFPVNSSITLGTCSLHMFSIFSSVFMGVTTRRINTRYRYSEIPGPL